MHGDNFISMKTETLDSYVTHIRQVATLLGYGDPQVVEALKEYTPYKIILGTFSYRRFKTSSRNSQDNIDKGKDR